MAFTSSMPDNYKHTALNLSIMLLPLYFTLSYSRRLLLRGHNIFALVIKALKIAVIIQLTWFGIQMLCYYGLGLDINKLIFVDTFHLVDNASFIRNWVWYPSGLTWHSAILGPLYVFGFIIFNNPYIRVLILIESIFCGNSTLLIGVILCALLLFVGALKGGKIRISMRFLIAFFIIGILGFLVIARYDLIEKIQTVFINLWLRFFGGQKDDSTLAHLGYYSDYLKIVKKSTLSQIIFGYGFGCSGYTITTMYNRYSLASTWAIESDIVNILVSRGIVGFVAYYYFLFTTMVKGAKIDYRYFVFIMVVIVQGFGYNVQFDYVYMIEALMYISIKMKLNFFESA